MKLELYHSAASMCSQKVRLCLAEKGLPWVSHHLVLREFEQLEPAYLALNPEGLVPLLLADGKPIRESAVINEFLEDSFPERPLRPADALGRARMREWTSYIASEPALAVKIPSFHRLVAPAVAGKWTPAEIDAIAARMPHRSTAARWRQALTAGFTEEEVEASLQRLRVTLDRMEQVLSISQWLAGENYSLADVEMTPFVRWHYVVGEGHAVEDRPRVSAWHAAVKARPSYAAAFDWRPEVRSGVNLANATNG
jgi:glutathione S-transferase